MISASLRIWGFLQSFPVVSFSPAALEGLQSLSLCTSILTQASESIYCLLIARHLSLKYLNMSGAGNALHKIEDLAIPKKAPGSAGKQTVRQQLRE